MRRVHAASAADSHAWLFDLLFGQSPLVTWAQAGQLPAGFSIAEQFAVLPAGGGRTFMVSLADRRGSSCTLTSYNALRSPRRRLARRALGLAVRTGALPPFLHSKIDIGTADDAPAGELAGALLSEHISGLLGGQPVVMAFGGGSGPYRKPVLQVFSTGGTPLGYVKVGWNAWTRDAVSREAAALRAGAAAKTRLGVPELVHHGVWQELELIMTAPLPAGVRRPAESVLPDAGLLREICELSPTFVSELAGSPWWVDLRTRINACASDQASGARLTQIADWLESQHGRLPLEFGRWHGDLVPWNLATLGSRTYAWDWESSAASAPVGFDALHFSFQVAFVAQRCPLDQAAALAARQARPALTALGAAAGAHSLLATLHLMELAVRHEEARSSAHDADERFFPAVLDWLENQARAIASQTAGAQTTERAA